MREYALMMWDGLGFFGCDNAKLGRLKGEPVTFTSKYKDFSKLSGTLLMVAIIIYVIASQVSMIGTQKDQTVQLIMRE